MRPPTLLLLSFATLLASAPGALQARDYVPGSVLCLGSPVWIAEGSVEELLPLRFSSPFELDAVARIGSEAVLVHHPARFRELHSLGSGFLALNKLPVESGTEVVLAADAAGLAVLCWTGGTPFFAKELLSFLEGWAGVTELWVSAEGGQQFVVGLAGGTLLRAVWNPAAGSVTSDVAWTSLPSWPAGSTREFLRFEYAPNAGYENAFLSNTQIGVLTSDASTLLLAGPSSPGDHMGSLQIGGVDYLLDLSPAYGSPFLFAGSALGAPIPPYFLGDRAFGQVLGAPGDPGESTVSHVLLPETSAGNVTALRIDTQASPLAFQTRLPNGLDTLDTYEASAEARAGVRRAAVGDFDLDGDHDLLVAHEGSTCLRLWLSNQRSADLERIDCTQLELMPTGSQIALIYSLRKGLNITEINEYRVQVWIDASHAGTAVAPWLHSDATFNWSSYSFIHSLGYSPAGLAADHVVWLAITGIQRENGVVVRRLPTRLIYYSPDAPTESTLAAEYPALMHGGPPSGTGEHIRRGPGSPPSGGGSPSP